MKQGYEILRDTVSTADSDLTSAQKTWDYFVANWKSQGSTSSRVPLQAKKAIVSFDHKNADADTASFSLYGYSEGGPAELICTGDLTAGDLATNDATARYYADTVDDSGDTAGQVNDSHITSVVVADGSGANGVTRLVFDTYHFNHILCLFNAISTSDNVRAKIAYTDD